MNAAMQHWQLTVEDSGVAIATFDLAGASTNTLSTAALAEFGTLLDTLDRQPPKGLIIRSGKTAGFIAGADVHEFSSLVTPEQGQALVRRGWDLMNRLAAVRYPTLALVRGHCLGGGLELALACRYLLAVDEPDTRMALPEVMLGIFPGWGGMLRLPQRVGPAAALDMMLTGRGIDARRARRMGLADDLVPPRVMESAARQLLLSGTPRRRLPLLQRLMAGPLKPVVAYQVHRHLQRKARPEHYPAPYAILQIWRKHGGNALLAPGLVNDIVHAPTTRNLLRVFSLQERLKSFGKAPDASDPSVPTVRRVHVIGAGVMGGDIAAWCALRGLTVTLQDQDLARIAPAIGRANKLFTRKLRDPLRVRDAMDRLIPDPEGQGVAHADVVIEAIVENLEAKHALLRTIEPRLKPIVVLASNTSSLLLEDIGRVLQQPRRLVGIHFFNPVALMPLVEVVQASGTDAAAVTAACAFVRQLDKLPLPVKSAPGFLVNAVLAPYMQEALRVVDEGVAPASVDAAMLDFGMPMGPIELADTVGLDVVLAAGRQLVAGQEVPRCLSERIASERLGRKSSEGFYVWRDGKAQKPQAPQPPAGLQQRLIAPIVSRARELVAAGVVADSDLADAGLIFGAGFAPYTGGPLHHQAVGFQTSV